MVIPFLIFAGIFLFTDTIEKTRIDAYLLVFNIGALLKNLVQCALYVNTHVFP